MVTSGAIALGMRVMELPQRPSSIEEMQAASAVGQGTLFAPMRRAWRPGTYTRRRFC